MFVRKCVNDCVSVNQDIRSAHACLPCFAGTRGESAGEPNELSSDLAVHRHRPGTGHRLDGAIPGDYFRLFSCITPSATNTFLQVRQSFAAGTCKDSAEI